MQYQSNFSLSKVEEQWTQHITYMPFDIALEFAFYILSRHKSHPEFHHPFQGYDASFKRETQLAIKIINKMLEYDYAWLKLFQRYVVEHHHLTKKSLAYLNSWVQQAYEFMFPSEPYDDTFSYDNEDYSK